MSQRKLGIPERHALTGNQQGRIGMNLDTDRDGTVWANSLTIYDSPGDVVYIPFIAEDGRVGYAVRDTSNQNGAETHVYLNPTSNSFGDVPTVFVYVGGDNDPTVDSAQFHVTFDEELGRTAKEVANDDAGSAVDYLRDYGIPPEVTDVMNDTQVVTAWKKLRLEELRLVLRAENMSYGELIELQGMTKYIDSHDVELLEAAGVPEGGGGDA